MVVAGEVKVVSSNRHRVPTFFTVTVWPAPVWQAPFRVGHSVALAGVQPGASGVLVCWPPPGRRVTWPTPAPPFQVPGPVGMPGLIAPPPPPLPAVPLLPAPGPPLPVAPPQDRAAVRAKG